MPQPQPLKLTNRIAITLLLAAILWLPRGLMLDHFVAVDERSWLTRSGNFYLALSEGNLAATFQRYHPGVTTMWLGMAGYLLSYPSYASDAAGQISDMSEGVEEFLRSSGYEPIDLLASGRSVVVIVTVLTLLVAFWIAVDLFGLFSALVGFLLIAVEPFLLGLTRMLHVDGLSSVFMFLSLLAYLRYIDCTSDSQPTSAGRYRAIGISAIAAGLAWLSKSPALFLIPFVALLTGYAVWRQWRSARDKGWYAILHPLMDATIWVVIAGAVFALLWPAMWVQPIESLRALFAAAGDSAATGHSKAIFYNGEIYVGDPGFWFYPHTYLWRTTPVIVIGLLLGIVTLLTGDPPLQLAERRKSTVWLLLFAILFTLFMTLGAKKFPRYLLPVYMPLNIVAGIGWTAVALWIGERLQRRWTVVVAVTVPLTLQAMIAWSVFPYYFTYYSSLLGGAARAPQVMMIGLGEGLDEAARYLRELPDAEENTVASWYRGGSFNYLYPYESVDIEDFYRSDYAVIYAHQWQRQVPNLRLLDYFASLTPERTIMLNGIEYARVYNLENAPPPAFMPQWKEAIRLVLNELSAETIAPGEMLVTRSHYLSIAPLDENLSVLVRLVDVQGNEITRSEGWPFGMPTSTWTPGDVYVDGHELTIPVDATPGYLRAESAFYDAETGELLRPELAATGETLSPFVPIGYVAVVSNEEKSAAGHRILMGPKQRFDEPIEFGDQITLTGIELSGKPIAESGAQVNARPGESMPLDLHWEMGQYTATDYTVLIQLLKPDGSIVAQWDGQPVQGLVPTSLWRSDGTIHDQHILELPTDLAPGEYVLLSGLYDLATMERLPIIRGDERIGDAFPVATVQIIE